jgi:Zn-dependent M28 family amino/carboxypeptidase
MRSLKAFFSLQLIIFLLVLPALAGRQNNRPADLYTPKLLAELKQLQKAALESDYAYKQTAYMCNNIGPRLSGSPGAARAVEYVADEMRRIGMDVQLEKVMVPHWVRGVETAELVQFHGQAPDTRQKIVLTALGGSVATPPEGLTAEVVVVESLEQLNALGRDRVTGKIVLFNAVYDKRLAEMGYAGDAYGQAVVYRGTGASAAARLGAVASLIRSVGSADFRLPHTGSMSYAEDAPRIPGGAVAAEDADLIAYLAAQGVVRMRLTLTPQTLADAVSYNVVADLKGSETPEQVVIVSGHLDSWDLGTGAIDDASGVAASMAVLQLIKQAGLRPRRTIRVIAWMNEENGLKGARAYAEDHKAELANHVAAIEMDGGAGHPAGFAVKASPKAIELIRPASMVLRANGSGVVQPIGRAAGADLIPLDAVGVPTFAPLSDSRAYFHYHHTAADTLDKIVPGELAANVAVLTVLAYAIASLSEPLPR